MKEKDCFTIKTKLKEILTLDIDKVAKLRWDEYQKCWSAKQFLWWEFHVTSDKSPVENFQLMYNEKFNVPLPIIELAKDFMFYINLKEQLLTVIKECKLLDNYNLYCTDIDKYLSDNRVKCCNYLGLLPKNSNHLHIVI